MDEQLKSNLTSSKHWLRLLYMVFFAICLQVSSIVMSVLVAVQFVFALITGKANENLRVFASSLTKYIYAALNFLTYNSEEKPFPFDDWPEADVREAANEADSPAVEVEPAEVEPVPAQAEGEAATETVPPKAKAKPRAKPKAKPKPKVEDDEGQQAE
ncbi:MAG: hypothetical protein ACI9Y1_002233 [Lentisphaeria bacterium]|jgi:hypothetical protein